MDEGAVIGDGTAIWHFSHIMTQAKIGEGCNIGQNVVISPKVCLGNNVKVQNNVSIYEGVQLEDFVFCGPSMVFTNVGVPRSKYPQRGSKYYSKTLVKHGASIGANATIVCGNTIGSHALIAAGAVVTKDVPNYAIIKGVPGKQDGWISEHGDLLNFNKNKVIDEGFNKAFLKLISLRFYI